MAIIGFITEILIKFNLKKIVSDLSIIVFLVVPAISFLFSPRIGNVEATSEFLTNYITTFVNMLPGIVIGEVAGTIIGAVVNAFERY